ncbi:GNAT family N-acetyltransferase [Paucihalobacter ruber]|uniref:GNAT family N-acetyltransferase n=1 Tax=Paucihalobacter ruber TaxID=2567861 RepID=A0A506PFL6_9FLAO|nr:GNAT family N-acetyltransferase [Paucihalobacter ruber]TPV32278.1 GNAT family N-acetyltransferase [Paucihalobacter ruber]
MTDNNYVIRPIQPDDNAKIAVTIRKVLIEMGVPKVGTAYADKALDSMFENYQQQSARYFVIELNDEIIGGAGIAPLDNYNGPVCELQKMYFLPEARGKGLGLQMMTICLEFAKSAGFKTVYLETMPYMKDAQKLYNKVGFKYIDGPMGDTGHYSCTVWMIKNI